MNRFVSNFTNKLDSKGRVSIPASFRAVLAQDGFEGLYVHPALDASALDAGGNVLLNEIDAFLSTLSPYSDERDHLSTALFGTSEILKVDPEGRVILTDSVKVHAEIDDAVTFVGLGHKFQIWEPDALPCALGGGAHEGARTEEGVGNPNIGATNSAGNLTRRTGAMMGRGDGPGAGAAGGPNRHVPVLLEEVCETLDAKRGGTFIDGTFGAGGYTRAILDANPRNNVVAIDRDPDAIAGGASLVAKSKNRLTLVAGPLRRSRPDRSHPQAFDARRRRRARYRRVVHAARRGRARLLVPQRRPARHAHGAERPERRRPRQRIAPKPNSPTSSTITARSAVPARSPAPSSRRAAGSRSRPREQLADLVASLIRQEPGGIHPATRVFQGLRIAVNDELGELVRALHAAERML